MESSVQWTRPQYVEHGFTLRRNAFVAKEHVGEDGVRYGTEVSQNRREDRLAFVDGFAMNRLTMAREATSR